MQKDIAFLCKDSFGENFFVVLKNLVFFKYNIDFWSMLFIDIQNVLFFQFKYLKISKI